MNIAMQNMAFYTCCLFVSFFLPFCIRSAVLIQGGIFYIVFWPQFCQFYDCSGERSNRAEEIGHRAATVGGLASRYRSSFFGDGELVRIFHGCLCFVYHPSFGETGTPFPSRSRPFASSGITVTGLCSDLGVWPMDIRWVCVVHVQAIHLLLLK